ncbi:hypothetical protein ACIHDR_47190 [Nocardia sp. NPDC052278]|uniref:hypothetical protein n=1 Tax=unclassified Nocardia TaxID=2637762 RepID=UPI0036C50E74
MMDDSNFGSDDEGDDSYSPDIGLDPIEMAGTPDRDPLRVAAPAPSGSGWVVLSGPGAGSTVLPAGSAAPGEYQLTTALPSLDEALSGKSPLMIVHCPHHHRGSIPRLLASVVGASDSLLAIAAAVLLPSAAQPAHAQWLDSCQAASIRIADPACYLRDADLLKVKTINTYAPKRVPYLLRDELDIAEVLDAQRAVGANLLLSSGQALDPADAESSLDIAFEQADDALAQLGPAERLALNLTISQQWLANPILRDALLARLIDQDQFDVWYIRVQWPSSLPTFHQPVDRKLLDGYKRLAQLASDEDRVLLLPQTGLTGWLQLGFGATGFGASLAGAGHAFREESRGGSGYVERVQRYFEPLLLHTVERSAHAVVSADEQYTQCTCPYCPLLWSKPDWDHQLAELHHLYWMGRLAAIEVTTGRSRPAAVRRTARAAQKAAAGLPLVGPNVPRHLPVWDQIL